MTKPKKLSKRALRRASAAFDEKLSEAFLFAHNQGISPQKAIFICTNNLMEFGLWATHGTAPLVASTMLQGAALQLKKYEAVIDEPTPEFEEANISIECHWLPSSDGNLETRFLLVALAEHLNEWMGPYRTGFGSVIH